MTYDDSDGWYDHAYATPTSFLQRHGRSGNGPGECGTGVTTQPSLTASRVRP